MVKKIKQFKTKALTAALSSIIASQYSQPVYAEQETEPNEEWVCRAEKSGEGWLCGQSNDISDGPYAAPSKIVKKVQPSVISNRASYKMKPAETDYRYLDWYTQGQLTQMDKAEDGPKPVSEPIAKQCHGRYVEPEINILDPDIAEEDAPIHANADETRQMEGNITEMEGNVTIRQHDRSLTGNYSKINMAESHSEMQGNVRFREPGVLLVGESAVADMAKNTVDLSNAEFVLHESGFRGKADTIKRNENGSLSLNGAEITSCEPGQNSWSIAGSDIELNTEKGFGTAKHMRLKVKGVPVAYSPIMYFPITKERRSGFLFPAIGVGSSDGADIGTPYYFNLAPNYDATVTPRYISKRGTLLEGEFRYLTDTTKGSLGAAYINRDDIRANDLYNPSDEERGLFTWKQSGAYNGWQTTIDANYVSDDEYFSDLGTDLEMSSKTHLRREFIASYNANKWDFTGSMLDFQEIDGQSSAYMKLPSLDFNYDHTDSNTGLALSQKVNYSFFTEDEENLSSTSPENIQRLHTATKVSWPYKVPAGFFTPSVTLKNTSYSIVRPVTGAPEKPQTTVPVYSLDAGLFFERPVKVLQSAYTQTLEPRLFYLRTPYKNQSDNPNVDTTATTFRYSQLFKEDRFSGYDRFGDADQLSLGLTSRFIDQDSGEERFRVGAGQIFYFLDRKVSTAGNTQTKEQESLMAGEASFNLNNVLRLSGDILYDTALNQSEESQVKLSYKSDNRHILNLGNRYRDNDIDQTEFSFIWPISGNWNAIGSWQNDLIEHRTLESFFGVEYDSCCWSVRIINRRYLKPTSDPTVSSGLIPDSGLFINFELKGLAGIGSDTDKLFSDSIPGYYGKEDE